MWIPLLWVTIGRESFDELKEFCGVVYLPRTDGVSTTSLKKSLSAWNAQMEESLHASLDALKLIANQLGS